MKFAVTTPSGNVGSTVATHLLDAGAEVILLARDPAKLHRFAERGARILQGTQEDPAFVVEATRGVDALFWVTPPSPASPDVRAFQSRVGRAGAHAISKNHIPRVVNLSSIGAHLAEGVGPVSGLHDVEELLNEVVQNITHLRPAMFYENYLWQVDAIRNAASVYMPIPGDVRCPMIASRDVGAVAAERLLNTTWSGHSIRSLHGPADLSFDEAAAEISIGLGRRIRHVQVPEEAVRRALLASGMGESMVELILEMYRAVASGIMQAHEVRTSETTTPTTLLEFARDVLAPLVIEAAVPRA